MITTTELIASLLQDQRQSPAKITGNAFAPSNIALIKYWGKRDRQFNLPVTSSLSVALGDKGANTTISLAPGKHHQVLLNDTIISTDSNFYKRLASFLDAIKPDSKQFYRVMSTMNLPVAAGLASSACGFAALVTAFADLYAWNLPEPILSILCRMGSGSACRSLWQGFVEWHAGERDDGLDSFAEPLPYTMPNLAIGLCILTTAEKPISSTNAMNRTTQTSILYDVWPKQVMTDLAQMKQALATQDFALMGQVAERNALAMHATMLSANPAVCYFLPETVQVMHTIWQLRNEGMPIYFTEDAGPNIKILAQKQDIPAINKMIKNTEWISGVGN